MGLNDFSLFFLSFSLQKSRNLFSLSLSLTFVFLLCIIYPVFDTHKKKKFPFLHRHTTFCPCQKPYRGVA